MEGIEKTRRSRHPIRMFSARIIVFRELYSPLSPGSSPFAPRRASRQLVGITLLLFRFMSGPVFRRAKNLPKVRSRRGEFDSHFRLVCTLMPNPDNTTKALSSRFSISDGKQLPGVDRLAKKHECTVGVDNRRNGFLDESLPSWPLTAYHNSDRDDHALASPSLVQFRQFQGLGIHASLHHTQL